MVVELIKRFTTEQYDRALESWQWLDLTGKSPLFTSLFGDVYLLLGLAEAAHRRGIVLGLEEVYDFIPPPVLAGGFDVANVTAMDFVVSLHIAGQLHEQVRDIPPGTAIREFQFRHP
jgi:hypothetical protein